MNIFSRANKSFLSEWWWTVDRAMLATFLVLIVFGIVLVATASPAVAERIGLDSFYFLKRHIVIVVPSIFILLGMSMLDRQQIWRLSSLMFLGSVFCLILVLFIGMEIKGAQRWIHLLGFSLQPSEFTKPAFLIVAAWLMALQKTKQNVHGNLIVACLYFSVITLFLMQPDLGMTVILTASWAAQIFIAGLPFRWLLAFGATGVIGMIAVYMSFHHVQSRIDRFLNPDSGDNFQIERSLEAFQNGGLFGAGPGQGTVKLGLPDAHADFIFSVLGEEFGLFFVIILMLIFAFILLRGYNRLMQSDDMFVVLAAGGLLTMFGLQGLVHMGSALHVLPTKGMTLPFISYGGSSLLSMSFAMGAVLALTKNRRHLSISKGGLSLFQSDKSANKSL